MKDGCVFCKRAKTPAREYMPMPGIMVFEPLKPVVNGHVLVVPTQHVEDATTDPVMTGLVMEVAARLARIHASANIITSVGSAATQTVQHLHIHVIPRSEGDGLLLPWSKKATHE